MSPDNYVQMMRESLENKVSLLKQIKEKNKEQGEILQDENSLPEAFEETITAKENLIDHITRLDDGFEQLYNRVKESLSLNRNEYSGEIRKMQMLIEEITDLSQTIQAQEQRNRDLAEKRFLTITGKVKEVRKSQQAVNTYYKTMMDRAVVDPQFMDNRK